MGNSDARIDALLASMGEAVRLRRRSLGLTLKDVQAATGLSHSFLSKVERGLVRPSMRSLTSVADVLGTTAHALMTLEAADEVGDVRSGSSLTVAHGDGVARALIRGTWPFLPVEYCAGPREFEEYYIHPGREMMYVAVGVCEMEIDGHGVYQLSPGESLFYGADVKHRWRKVSRGAIRVLLIQENAGGGPVPPDAAPRMVGHPPAEPARRPRRLQPAGAREKRLVYPGRLPATASMTSPTGSPAGCGVVVLGAGLVARGVPLGQFTRFWPEESRPRRRGDQPSGGHHHQPAWRPPAAGAAGSAAAIPASIGTVARG